MEEVLGRHAERLAPRHGGQPSQSCTAAQPAQNAEYSSRQVLDLAEKLGKVDAKVACCYWCAADAL